MRFVLAVRAFFRILFDSHVAQRVSAVLVQPSAADQNAAPASAVPSAAPKTAPVRNDAVGLLAALQREARFLDFVYEPLDGFSDAQIGSAARNVHRQTKTVLDRMFGIQPLSDRADGETIELPADYDAVQWKLVGNVEGQPPFRGAQTHHGWKAVKCELPQWSGSQHAANILAPIELEIS